MHLACIARALRVGRMSVLSAVPVPSLCVDRCRMSLLPGHGGADPFCRVSRYTGPSRRGFYGLVFRLRPAGPFRMPKASFRPRSGAYGGMSLPGW
ncbi:hypothetical protein San01_51090 [Streptomyces angustmyceticus]|uniref:Uncharacterized protein n=1 Tax=Streptomyces angustmyceticus TaxID=285578 RepID=A0A5J4LKT2_9ACTN|nr:hypothetical protein San01_51090 [Streptomyces angustmyceticus]